jgi:hypothetical protein
MFIYLSLMKDNNVDLFVNVQLNQQNITIDDL